MPRFASPMTCNLKAGKLNPMPIFPPNSPMETVPLALTLINGRPVISLTAKMVPLERLLLIENNWPLLPSNEIELSARTLKVIGEFAWPIKLNEGIVVPVPPNVPLVNNRLPTTVVVPPMVAAPFTLKVLLNVTEPVTPMPPCTSNVVPIPTLVEK